MKTTFLSVALAVAATAVSFALPPTGSPPANGPADPVEAQSSAIGTLRLRLAAELLQLDNPS